MNNNKKSIYVSIYNQNLKSLKEYQATLNYMYDNYKYFKVASIADKKLLSISERFEVQIEFYKHRIKQVVDTIKIYKYKIRNIDRDDNS